MRMKKINEHQIRCVLTNEDLAMRKITVKELRYGSLETKALFQEMVQDATRDYGFNEEELPVMIEAIPMSSDELLVILSAVEETDELDPHFANYAKENPEEDEIQNVNSLGEKQVMIPERIAIRFPNIKYAVMFCRSVKNEIGSNWLYKRKSDGAIYILIDRNRETEENVYADFVNLASEYGIVETFSEAVFGYFEEHETPVLFDPVRKLKK